MKRAFAFFIMAAVFLAACQPTPGKDAVVNKERDYLEGKENAPFSPYAAPETVEYPLTRSGLMVNFEAGVIIPEAASYSVEEVKRTIFDSAAHLNMIEFFLPAADLVEEPTLTKEDILSRIARVYELWPEDEPGTAQMIAELEEALKNAPAQAVDTPLNLAKTPEGERYSAYAKNTSGGYSMAYGIMGGSDFGYRRDSACAIYSQGLITGDSDQEWWASVKADYEGVFPITCEEAEQTAMRAVRELGLTEMAIISREKCVGYDTYGKPVLRGWYFTLTHANNGLPIYFDFQGAYIPGGIELPALSAPWGREVLLISVDEQGISGFELRGACSVTRELFSNVPLVPFDEMLGRIENQLVYQHAGSAAQLDNPRLNIYAIRLCSALVSVADQPDIGRLIPAWEVQYSLAYEYGKEKMTGMRHFSTMFNAIDGSYIEPRISAEVLSELAVLREK